MIPIIVGIIKYSTLDISKKLIWYLCCYTLLGEIGNYCYLNFYDVPPETKNNSPLFHFYSYIEFGILAFIFYRKSDNLRWKRMIKVLCLVFYSFSIVNLIFWESVWVFNSNQRFVEGIFVFIILFAFFIDLLKNVEDVYFERNSYFWLSTGFLMYFTGTLFVFLFENKFIAYEMASPKEEFIDYHGYIHGIIFIVLLLHYSVFLWMREKN